MRTSNFDQRRIDGKWVHVVIESPGSVLSSILNKEIVLLSTVTMLETLETLSYNAVLAVILAAIVRTYLQTNEAPSRKPASCTPREQSTNPNTSVGSARPLTTGTTRFT
ncbi:hypothetical protein HYG81_21175 (plasmid) [Natrinema zhouii]|uniref:hypothetical protein n=1 Tax=Natrinema zhouii TaxID=1710539 RepID=UPI001CFFE1FA|nr:hypothetical protein [Natrinema zhouii]UHQ98102.1 hypothetical protein HYG81_21175 [Natrinema zhouii]